MELGLYLAEFAHIGVNWETEDQRFAANRLDLVDSFSILRLFLDIGDDTAIEVVETFSLTADGLLKTLDELTECPLFPYLLRHYV